VIALLPWMTGVRGATKNRRRSALLTMLAALAISSAFAASTINRTGSFDAQDVADIAMGQADVLARTGDGVVVDDIVIPTASGAAAVTHVVQDLDLTVTLVGPGGTETVTGRLLSYSDPITEGMFVRGPRAMATGGIALSPALARSLDVTVGDEVHVRSGEGGVRLTVDQEVLLAPDAAAEFFLLDPAAVPAAAVDRIITSAVAVGTPRWLLASDDLGKTASYVEELGLRPLTRSGFTAPEQPVWLDLDLILPAIAVSAVLVTMGGVTALARAHRRQADVLDRLGAPTVAIRGSAVVESLVATAVGVVLAVPLGLITARLGSTLLERSATQEWGAIEPAWGTFALAGIGTLLVVPAVVLVGVADGRSGGRANTTGPLHRSAPVSSARLLGGRLAERGGRSTWLGAVAVSALIAVGSAAVLVVGVASASYAALYEPVLPAGVVAFSVPRPLTDREAGLLAAKSNGALLEDRRVAFRHDRSGMPVPLVLDSAVSRCLRDGLDPMTCAAKTGTIVERSVAVVDKRQVEGLLGRTMTGAERHAFEHGDGLLLTATYNGKGLVPPGRYQASPDAEPFHMSIDPVSVDGFDFDRYPGLLVSATALERWGLFIDDSPVSYYLLSPVVGPVDHVVVRAALPTDLGSVAEVLIDEGPVMLDDLRTATRAVLASSIVVVFLLVALIMMTWANDSAPVLRPLRSLGMRSRELVGVLVARGMRVIAAAAALGMVLALALTWIFARSAGVAIPIVGFGWALPAVAALGALLMAAVVQVLMDADD